MKPDFDKYREMLTEYDISDKERDEFIATVWSLCLQFVDMGLGVENTQLVLKEIWDKAGASLDDSGSFDYTSDLKNNKKHKDFEP